MLKKFSLQTFLQKSHSVTLMIQLISIDCCVLRWRGSDMQCVWQIIPDTQTAWETSAQEETLGVSHLMGSHSDFFGEHIRKSSNEMDPQQWGEVSTLHYIF